MIVLPYRVKILIPEPFFWWPGEERETFVLNSMAGANVDFVIIAVDRPAGCAVASRTMALSRRRWEAKEIAHWRKAVLWIAMFKRWPFPPDAVLLWL